MEQARAGDPALEGDQRVAILAAQVSDLPGGDERLQEGDDDGDLIPVKEVAFDEREGATRLAGERPQGLATEERIGHARVREELAFGFRGTEGDPLAAVVEDDVFVAEQLSLQEREQPHVLAVGRDEIVDVVMQKEVARFARVVLSHQFAGPPREARDLVEREEGSRARHGPIGVRASAAALARARALPARS
ncbi:hypothetical protein HRbin08_01768 [bacterium HR08]|nr:hypothetical protein HRbin08_01768 [bacterium HR08]